MLPGKQLTRVYYVRHAEPDFDDQDDYTRALSAKGMVDRKLVTQYLADKKIDVVVSSPFKRAIDTIKDFADLAGLDISFVNDFRERKVDSGWIEDFDTFTQRQWRDFSFKLPDGESLQEVQERNIAALKRLMEEYRGKKIVIGGYGTALSTIIHYYDQSFGYKDFVNIKEKMPWIVEFEFENAATCRAIHRHDLF